VALTQSLARLELCEGADAPSDTGVEEALQENRFLAARDGMDAELIDIETVRRRPVRELLAEALAVAGPHAQDLGCVAELAGVVALATEPGAQRQRRLAAAGGGAATVSAALAAQFT